MFFEPLPIRSTEAPELRLPRDVAGEAEREEARTRELWRKHCPEVFNAREAVDAAQREHADAIRICQERERRVMTARNAVNNANPDVMGELGDAQSRLAIASGYAQVAKHNVALAQSKVNAALAALAVATGVKERSHG